MANGLTPEAGQPLGEGEDFLAQSLAPARPLLESCCVLSVAGNVTSDSALHRALQEKFIPHSLEFVSGLIEAVRNQQPIDPKLIIEEERLVRRVVEEAGDVHGTSGFKDSVTWIQQEIAYLSCKPDFDPTMKGQSCVPLQSFELYDQRAYRDGKLTLTPNRTISRLGFKSIIGADPTFIFEFEPSGLTQWSSMRKFLAQLSGTVPTDQWEDFRKVERVTWKSRYKGCYYVDTKDGLELVIVGPNRNDLK